MYDFFPNIWKIKSKELPGEFSKKKNVKEFPRTILHRTSRGTFGKTFKEENTLGGISKKIISEISGRTPEEYLEEFARYFSGRIP